MSLSLTQSKTALGPNLTASFLAIGGTEPYVYSVLPDGAGGSIDAGTGLYTAPTTVNDNPKLLFDTIQVMDDLGATATGQVLVGDPLLLFCEIIQREMGLANGRVYIWDQKIFQPTDNGLYIPISILNCKVIGNNIKPDPDDGWANPIQYTVMSTTIDIDIISRGPAARVRKEEIILALNSVYSQQQQEGNNFYIGKLPWGNQFHNLSLVDGAAIPYRFKISVEIQYAVSKQKTVPYFDTFEDVALADQP